MEDRNLCLARNSVIFTPSENQIFTDDEGNEEVTFCTSREIAGRNSTVAVSNEQTMANYLFIVNKNVDIILLA